MFKKKCVPLKAEHYTQLFKLERENLHIIKYQEFNNDRLLPYNG